MSFADLLVKHGLSMAELNRRYEIPLRSMEDWKAGRRKAPDYVLKLLDMCLQREERRN